MWKVRPARAWSARRTGQRVSRATILGALSLSSTSATAASVHPKSPTACLDWSAMAAACPSAPDVARSVDEILGRNAVDQSHCDVTVHGRAEQSSAGGWTVIVRLVRRDGTLLGERRLNSVHHGCSSLRNPLALVVALVLEQDAPELAVQIPPVDEPLPHKTVDAAPSRWASAASVQGAMALGLLPQLAFGPALGISAGPPDVLMAGVHLGFWLPNSEEQAGRGGSFWAWHAGIELCPHLFATRGFELAWCAHVQGGAIVGNGTGLDVETSASRPYAHVGTSLRGSLLTVGALHLVGEIGAAVPLARPRFVYRDQAEQAYEVHRPAEVIGQAALGIEVRGFGRAGEASAR